ncbi:MAG: hypothetical protein ABGZ17_15950 [Planctomycetaceae bacterium]
MQDRLTRCYCRILVLSYVWFLYALSIGPMFWLWYDSKYLGGASLVARIYEPLLWSCEIPPVGRAVNWYINLWIL